MDFNTKVKPSLAYSCVFLFSAVAVMVIVMNM
ncbi:MAG: hypothetical protein Greene101415_1149 [Parcubacteria group bacterium Greene1014_15]|nr:MAG: hypothetical protein Greene101415_1149 [Parcubacteria group bacterium Greene1014_15]